MPCSIKRSLRERLDASKTFVLVVDDKTKDLSCRYCVSYSPYGACHRSGLVDHRSFIEYECEYAAAIDRIVRPGGSSSSVASPAASAMPSCVRASRSKGVRAPDAQAAQFPMLFLLKSS